LNLHGALNAETYEVTLIESSTVNTDSTIQLLEIIDQKYSVFFKIVVTIMLFRQPLLEQ